MSNQDSIILQTSSVLQVTYQGSGMHLFQPHAGRKPLTLKQQQEKEEKDATFKKQLDEAWARIKAEEKTGGDAA